MLSRMRDSMMFQRLAAIGPGLRDSLIRDNKVIPLVLGVLVLLILFWIAVAFFLGGRDDEPVSNRAFVSQSPELAQQSGATGSPSPELENRNAESYAAYQSKDPFRELIPPADSASAAPAPDDGATDDGTSDGTSGPSAGDGGSGGGGSGGRGPSRDGSGGGNGDGGFGNGGGGFGNGGGSGGGPGGGSGGGSGSGFGGGSGGGPGGGGGRGGNGNLFDSGGSLPY
jgi:hypothetical protein